jgi:aspartokinase-like uncharacterized kinase
VVVDRQGMSVALESGLIPVLAPFSWLRRDDPLPHSWDVTSDSIAAWVARAIGARRLVLVKPPGMSGSGVVDGYFDRVRGTLATEAIPADAIDTLRQAMRPSAP